MDPKENLHVVNPGLGDTQRGKLVVEAAAAIATGSRSRMIFKEEVGSGASKRSSSR